MPSSKVYHIFKASADIETARTYWHNGLGSNLLLVGFFSPPLSIAYPLHSCTAIENSMEMSFVGIQNETWVCFNWSKTSEIECNLPKEPCVNGKCWFGIQSPKSSLMWLQKRRKNANSPHLPKSWMHFMMSPMGVIWWFFFFSDIRAVKLIASSKDYNGLRNWRYFTFSNPATAGFCKITITIIPWFYFFSS